MINLLQFDFPHDSVILVKDSRINIMAKSRRKAKQEKRQKEQEKKFFMIVGVITLLLLIILYFSFRNSF